MARAGASARLERVSVGVEWEEPPRARAVSRSPVTERPRDQGPATLTPVPSSPAQAAARPPTGGVAGRRTITIQGRGAERNLPMPPRAARQRQKRRAYERAYFKPDRVAMWAVLLGLLLVLVAAMSGHP